MTHRAEDADPNVPWNFCGHVHEKYKVKRLNENSLIVNLCVEVWNYYPVSFEEISSAVSAFLKEEKKTCAQGDTKGTKETWAHHAQPFIDCSHRWEAVQLAAEASTKCRRSGNWRVRRKLTGSPDRRILPAIAKMSGGVPSALAEFWIPCCRRML